MAQLQARLRAIGNTRTLMQQAGLEVVRMAKLTVPRKTGNLGRSIRVTQVSEQHVTVAATANYAAFVELGTRAHEITPRQKRALRWAASPAGRRLTGSPRVGAAVVFATRVHHPGTKPKPYLLPAARKVASALSGDVIVQEWNGAS